MKIALIGCMVFARDVSHFITTSNNTIHPFWIEQGLHDTPQILNKAIQSKIDEIENLDKNNINKKPFDAIVLAYGLCSNAVIGLSSKKYTLIVPRCDDCMALFLGSQERYLDIFNSNKGIYWFNKSWCENASMPTKEKYEIMRKNFLERFDEDNVDFLMEMEMSFIENYECAYFIKSSLYDDEYERKTIRKSAQDFNWTYTEVDSDLSFISDLLNGNWDDKFLICKPTQTIVAEYTGLKISAK